jgi:quinol monooxygenase YgiN
MHSLVAVGGVLVAAVGSGVLLTRFFRTPRGDLIAWAIGLLGLLISLGAQAMGYLSGFDASMFRAMELGGQVIAPMAFLVALSEVAGRSGLGRFCSRLYIGALGIVALVVLALDQLTTARFSKAFPPAATFYQTPPNYLLMYAIGPLTALVAVIAVLLVLSRSGEPGWHDALQGQLLGGLAALCLAYPGLAQLASQHVKIHIPLGSVFAILCTLAAGLAWLAGLRSAALPLAVLHGQADPEERADTDRRRDHALGGYGDGDRDSYDRRPSPRRGDGYDDHAGYAGGNGYRDRDAAYQDSFGDGGVYRGGGLYRPEPPGQDVAGRRTADRPGSGNGDRYAEFATGDFLPADLVSGGVQLADGAGLVQGGRWQSRSDDDRAERRRAQLFGQITIYTLLEDELEAFDRLTDRVVAQVRTREPDTLVFIAHAVPSARTQRILYQVYRSRAAYERHLAQPYIKQFDLDRRPYVIATNVVELGLQQAKISPFPSVTELFPEPGYDTSGFERPDYLRDYGRPSTPGGGSREYR